MSKQYDPMDTHAQDRARTDKETRERLALDTEVTDLKWLMGSKRGRRIVWRQLERAGVFRLSFNTNAMQMAFAEGNRNEGLRQLALIHAHCPDHYTTMVREQNEHKHSAGAN